MFAEQAEWHLRAIVVYTQNGAKEILVELLKGADFAQMAKERSKSKSAASAGDLGFVNDKDLRPHFARVLATMEAGDTSSVFKGPDGYYIIKLEEKKGGRQLEFSKVKQDIITGLTQMKQQDIILKHIEELKQKTPVRQNDALLSSEE